MRKLLDVLSLSLCSRCAHSIFLCLVPQVRGLIDMLDPELAAALPPLLPRRTPSRLGSRSGSGVDAAGDQQQQDGGAGDMAGAAATPASPGSAEKRAAVGSLFEGLCTSDSEDDSDEDWRADLEREAKLQVGGWCKMSE